MVGLGSVLRHHVVGKRSGRDLSRMPFGVARVAPRCGQPGFGAIAHRGSTLGLGIPLVRRAGHLANPAPNEVRGLVGSAKWLGRCMAATWPPPPPNTVLVPVPSHWRRRLRRGFNPVESLARGLSHTWGYSVEPSLLVRAGHRRSLTGSSRTERMRVLQACYVAEPTATPGNVVLVDDVLTTGATYRTCAQALAAEGHTCFGGVWLAMA